ncbi:MAG: P-II family nitrogen regulator [Planctomycetota bacterium]|nr:P-II family nitrogen regulator [Planctomycetota bacterium]
MLKAIVIVRASRAEALCLRLLAVPWVEALSVREARGYGRQKEWLAHYLGEQAGDIEFLPRAVVECAIPRSEREAFVQLVLAACRSGRIGDGKLLFVPILQTLDIDTEGGARLRGP